MARFGDRGFFDRLIAVRAGAGREREEGPGIDRAAVYPNLEMHVRTMSAAGGADLADVLTGGDRRADGQAGGEGRHMRVSGDDAVGMADIDDVAVRVIPAGIDDGTAGGRADRGAVRRHHIQAGVAMAKTARDVFELDRRASHRAAEAFRVGGKGGEGQ